MRAKNFLNELRPKNLISSLTSGLIVGITDISLEISGPAGGVDLCAMDVAVRPLSTEYLLPKYEEDLSGEGYDGAVIVVIPVKTPSQTTIYQI